MSCCYSAFELLLGTWHSACYTSAWTFSRSYYRQLLCVWATAWYVAICFLPQRGDVLSQLLETADYANWGSIMIEDGWGPQWRPESAETFIFRNTLWPSGRFLRGFFFKNYLGWRGPKISLKISSGAQSENLEPSLTIQEFFSKKYSWFIYSVCVPFLGS